MPLLGRCVSAEPAALLAALLAVELPKVLAAAMPALDEVCLFGAMCCDKALPAADFAALLLDGLLSVFAALLAAGFEVTSFDM